MNTLIWVIIFLSVVLLAYALLVIYINDFHLPILNLENLVGKKNKYKIMSIDPHPDDETMLSGGLLACLARADNVEVYHICLTCGEKGDEKLKCSEKELAETRKRELKNALEILGIENFKIWNLGDGRLVKQEPEIYSRLKQEVKTFNPDIIVVYEKAGLYGHPDHIILSKVVSELVDKQYKHVRILYKTLPANALKMTRLPLHMAEAEVVQKKPKYRLPVWRVNHIKYRAARQHKSQNLAHGGPVWLKFSVFINEYYTDEY